VDKTLQLTRNEKEKALRLLLFSDYRNKVHLFYRGDPGSVHITRESDEEWFTQETLPDPMYTSYSAFEINGNVHTQGTSDGKYQYFRWLPEQGWFLSSSSGFPYSVLTVDAQGRIHAADKTTYRTMALAKEPAQISLWQSISLPADLHKPTLSFMARQRGGQTNGTSYYEVSVDDGLSITPVITVAPTSPSWDEHWAALDEWAGEQITVTFTLYQAAGEPMAYLDLDDVSVGSWLTPVIESIAPAEIPQPEPDQAITIVGENFIQKPTVYLNQVKVEDNQVVWVDEHTLEVTLPEDLGPGTYPLKVVNPGGQIALAQQILQIGYFIDLPLVNR
jgi:hypothetical protein